MTAELQPLDHDSPTGPAAVAVATGAVGLHSGVVFRSSDHPQRLLHLAFHHRLQCDAATAAWAFVPPAIDPIDLQVLAGLCATLAAVRPRIPYGFRRGTSRFDDEGRFVPSPGDSGLTCSTFIMALFSWARIPLLDEASWQARPEDEVAQRELLDALRGRATAEHVAAVEAEVGCMRFRPEEVAAASGAHERPVPFPVAAELGAQVLNGIRLLGL